MKKKLILILAISWLIPLVLIAVPAFLVGAMCEAATFGFRKGYDVSGILERLLKSTTP